MGREGQLPLEIVKRDDSYTHIYKFFFAVRNSVRHGLGRLYGPRAWPPLGLGLAKIVRNEWALDEPWHEF